MGTSRFRPDDELLNLFTILYFLGFFNFSIYIYIHFKHVFSLQVGSTLLLNTYIFVLVHSYFDFSFKKLHIRIVQAHMDID